MSSAGLEVGSFVSSAGLVPFLMLTLWLFPLFVKKASTQRPDFGTVLKQPQATTGVANQAGSELPGFMPVTPEEFAAIPSTTKGRAKLEEVNQVYVSLLTNFRSRPRSQGPFSIPEMTEMGLKITGTTGTARLHCLKYLGILDINKAGAVTLL